MSAGGAQKEIVTLGWLVIFHLFGVIMWVGTLLLISRLMALVPDEIGVAKERLIVNAGRLLRVSGGISAAVAIVFGIFIILANTTVLRHGWLHVKILLVLAMLAVHIWLYRRIVALENAPASATRREFSITHGIVSVLLLAILALVILQPF